MIWFVPTANKLFSVMYSASISWSCTCMTPMLARRLKSYVVMRVVGTPAVADSVWIQSISPVVV